MEEKKAIAEQSELWPSHGLPFLQEVIDDSFILYPRTGRHFADLASQFVQEHPLAAELENEQSKEALSYLVQFGLWLCEHDHFDAISEKSMRAIALMADLARRKLAGESFVSGTYDIATPEAKGLSTMIYQEHFDALKQEYLLLCRIYSAILYS